MLLDPPMVTFVLSNQDHLNFMTTQKIFISILSLVAVLAWGCQNGSTPSDLPLTNLADSASYAFGKNIGESLGQQFPGLSHEILAMGIRHAIEGEESLIDPSQLQAIAQKYQTEAFRAAGEENQAKADAFLAENKSKEGVIELENGLQYEVLQEGTGATPTVEDQVTIHYHGTLLDGTVFDSSVDRGQPATFKLSGLIPAWQIAVPLMKEGGKIRIYSPPALAYGPRGSGSGSIGPNEALIFDIELIKVGAEEN